MPHTPLGLDTPPAVERLQVEAWRKMSAAIVRVQGPRLDRAYLRDGAVLLDVSDLLERALSEAQADEGA